MTDDTYAVDAEKILDSIDPKSLSVDQKIQWAQGQALVGILRQLGSFDIPLR